MTKRIGNDGTRRARGFFAAARGRLRAVLALAGAVLLIGASGEPQRTAVGVESPAAEVRIEEFRFAPVTLEVQAGTTVRWVNQDEEIHAVAFLDGTPVSPALETDAVFTRRFDVPGTYTYRCAIHPHMAGTIVVR